MAGMTRTSALLAVAALALVGACETTVKIEPPSEPIVINLNIKIEQEVRVKIDRAVDELLKEEGLF